MGRRPTIDREAVLDAAEGVVSERGASGLTIDAVAKAAGITKGGVQSCFGNKEAMIEAMLIRWNDDYQYQVTQLSGGEDTSDNKLKAHILTTVGNSDSNNSRSAVLLSALLQSPEDLGWVREWYMKRQNEFMQDISKDNDLRRVAFLATEGFFFLRYFKLIKLENDEWERNANAILRLLANNET